MSSHKPRHRWLPLIALLAFGGCGTDWDIAGPDRPGTWRPDGSNVANLQASVATPSHLDRGVGASTERGAQGSDAVDRLLDDRRRALPLTRTTTVGGPAVASPGGR